MEDLSVADLVMHESMAGLAFLRDMLSCLMSALDQTWIAELSNHSNF